MNTMVKFRIIKKITKMGVRRFVEIPKDYYKVAKVGDDVVIEID